MAIVYNKIVTFNIILRKNKEVKMDRISEAKEFLKKIVAINSVESAPTDGAPFGRGGAEGLAVTLQKMRSLSFRTVEREG